MDLPSRILAFNSAADPEWLHLKYKAMREDLYRFFRGTTHLFYEDIPASSFLHKSPPVWLCGDLHLENFGTYKADNRIIYFDINDFDESILGPCYLDLVRMLSCIHIAAPALGLSTAEAEKLCRQFTERYHKELASGQGHSFEKESASGPVKELLKEAGKRKRKAFLKKYTEGKEGSRLSTDDRRRAALSAAEKAQVAAALHKFAEKTSDPDFYTVRDICFRIAGTSSLGLKRYVALVEGKGSPDNNYLLDIKEARHSCLEAIHTKQPAWPHEAARIAEVQKHMLPEPPALLDTLEIAGKSFVIRELQPTQDRIDHKKLAGNYDDITEILEDMAVLYASCNLRSSGRQGSTIADELISFARRQKGSAKELIDYAHSCSEKTKEYYEQYKEAYDKGFFD